MAVLWSERKGGEGGRKALKSLSLYHLSEVVKASNVEGEEDEEDLMVLIQPAILKEGRVGREMIAWFFCRRGPVGRSRPLAAPDVNCLLRKREMGGRRERG